jgi:hypothetical protein
MKKIAIIGVFVFAIALTANVAFAYDGCCFPVRKACCPEVNVNVNNCANVQNIIDSKASTGWNKILGGNGSASIITGAASATSFATTTANQNWIDVAGILGKINVTIGNRASVLNTIDAKAKTGGNFIDMCECGTNQKCGKHRCYNPCPCPDASIRTGAADAMSYAATLVNSNVVNIK